MLKKAHLFEGIESINKLRDKAANSFVMPTKKTEAWKYTPVSIEQFSPIDSQLFAEKKDINCSINLPFEAYELHFYNGALVTIFPAMPQGIEIYSLLEAINSKKIESYLQAELPSPFALLNTAYLEEGVFIKLNKNLNKPLIIVYHSDEAQLMGNIRNIIVVGENVAADIIEYHYAKEEVEYFSNIVNQIFVAQNSVLEHYKLQEESRVATHLALNVVDVEENGVYNSTSLQKGATTSRFETVVNLREPQACANIAAAYVAHDKQLLDTTTTINHLVPNTNSEQLIKGIIDGDGHGVFQGKIHIAPQAVQTAGHQLHKAMLLSDKAEVSVKPELEIFADDVKCSHGAACGELDAEQLFYMRSHGIDEQTARNMLLKAYIEEVFDKVKNENIHSWFLASLGDKNV